MSLKTILFLATFVAACGGTLYHPLLGVIAYMMHYQMGLEQQWWAGGPVQSWGIRYSLTLAIFTFLGIILNRQKVRLGGRFLEPQEMLILVFVALVWICHLLNPSPDPQLGENPAEVKLTKVAIFLLMLTHVVTTQWRLNVMFWALVAGSLFLGYQAFTAPGWMFVGNRLDVIGGPDFRNSNALAAFLAACLPIIGIQFLVSGWKGRVLCAVSSGFTVNAIVLTRARGAVVGLASGLAVALLAAPKGKRMIILAGIALVAAAGYALTDPGFWERASTVTAAEEERDTSAQSRIDIWRGSLRMLSAHPLGIGPENFKRTIGDYAAEHAGRDAHNTYVLAYSELGLQGLLAFLFLAGNAGLLLRRIVKECKELPGEHGDRLRWYAYAVGLALSIYLACSLTLSTLYLEFPYWLLAMPICIWRALQNTKADLACASVPNRIAVARRSASGSGSVAVS